MNLVEPRGSLNVTNVDAAVAFYEKVFDVPADAPGFIVAQLAGAAAATAVFRWLPEVADRVVDRFRSDGELS